MNESTIQRIASRVRGLGRELLAIANDLDAQAPHLSVQIPDLFTQMGLTTDDTMAQVGSLCDIHANPGAFEGLKADPDKANVLGTPIAAMPAKRTYIRVRCRMKDEAIVAADKVGRSKGYCQRSDIERSLRRTEPGRSREEIREAVNDAVAALGLTCIVYNSYRYYRRSDRKRIIDTAMGMFKPLR